MVRRLIAFVLVVLLLAPAIPAQAGATWKVNPVWSVDGALVDLGFRFDQKCVTGPIAVTIAYPAGAAIALVDESEGPDQGYTWTTEARSDLELSAGHVEIVATAVVPGDCGSKVEVRLTPISDRFQADEARGRYGESLTVRS